MSYTALYRKYRPDTFDEVKGQEHIVTTIRNQIKFNRIGHAYLFCGTRGTGKTTVAKLLAKAVNCEHPVDGSPCEECASCRAIQAGSSLNVVEIDAASNNGVDNIRQINDAVQYSPTQGKYLVYIIDEVHMLSSGAFNALLKTLEEPPAYVIFILATTESHKVLDTIKSRCQRFDFRRISQEVIQRRLKDILTREGIAATDEAVAYIASAADGSMRDSLSILDQCISFNLGEELTYERVLNTIGAVDIDVYMNIAEAIRDDDAGRMLDEIARITLEGRDLTKFTEDFVWFFRNMLFMKLSNGIENAIDLTKENAERIRTLGQDFTETTLMRFLEELQELTAKVRLSSIKRVTLEMGLIKLLKPEMNGDIGALQKRVEELEKREFVSADMLAGVQGATGMTSNSIVCSGASAGVGDTDRLTDTDTALGPGSVSNMAINGSSELGETDGTVAGTGTASSTSYSNGEYTDIDLAELQNPLAEKIKDKVHRTPEEYIRERVEEKKAEARKNYGDALYSDIENLASQWRTKVVPKLGDLYEKQLQMAKVVPYKGETGDVALQIVFEDGLKSTVAYSFISTHLDKISEEASDAIGKKVEVTIQTLSQNEMLERGVQYESLDRYIKKIDFEVEIV
ncbi:MAG: DNA polymerase III subunit gamma/tau [Eubacterium sp.]|nr:DNA polymerase III subunit gamma/tau [Eubacterium sp.]